MTSTVDRMLHPDEALEIVLRHVRPLPSQAVPLAESAGRILAEDFVADQDLPPFPASTMDGFAVIASDVSPWREIIGDQFAGTMEGIEITPGTSARIMTGAPLPLGADAVVRVENTELREDHIVIHQEIVEEGENLRPIGSDLRAGDVLVKIGATIGPAEIGLLASLGHTAVTVFRRPRVSILSTGDELVEPDQTPGPGQIRDSNRFSLAVAAEQAGAEVIWSGHAPDDEPALRQLIVERVAASDMVITSGGVSMGDKDFVKAILNDIATVHFRRLFMKPGKPFNFATADDRTLIFGLPGNPVSALVEFEVFIRSAMRAMAGHPHPEPARATAILDHDVESTDRLEYQRGVVRVDESGQLRARNTGSQISARLMSLVGANAYLLIQPREAPYRAGERVPVLLLHPVSERG
ncbi:MAG TPA: gephyrin-like molybdotransferase Glp [Nitrolancea sp.]|jgi:molybdenum cofactor synthesis domain-containing protein|nr:gephyrin-like molybdotransferase Glp [Nitrolancea sp.]